MWLIAVARGRREIGLHCLGDHFVLCGLTDLCVRRAVHEGQWCCG